MGATYLYPHRAGGWALAGKRNGDCVPPTEIRTASVDEAAAAIDCLVAAFIADPLTRFAWPSSHAYLTGMPRVSGGFGGAAFEAGSAYLSGDLCGAALWLPPGVHPDGESVEQGFRETAEPAHLDDLLGTFEKMDEWHPEEPHWYLPLIGVDPHARGRGLGGALMAHATARADADGLPAYLESSNPRNISLYERHGFEVMGEIRVGAAPVVTPMFRKPRSV